MFNPSSSILWIIARGKFTFHMSYLRVEAADFISEVCKETLNGLRHLDIRAVKKMTEAH